MNEDIIPDQLEVAVAFAALGLALFGAWVMVLMMLMHEIHRIKTSQPPPDSEPCPDCGKYHPHTAVCMRQWARHMHHQATA